MYSRRISYTFNEIIMTEEIYKLYEKGLENKEFLDAIKSADNDEKPNLCSSQIEKHLFVSTYYGWLVGKFGDNWKIKA